MKNIAITFLLLIASVTANAIDFACEPRELEENRDLADIIFVGKLVEDKTNEGYVLVNVLRRWKGSATGNIKLISSERFPSGLLSNEYYLFYLNSAENGMFSSHPCNSRVTEVEFAGKDLLLLGEPTWSSGNE